MSPPVGRPAKGEQPRNKSLQIRLSENEMQLLDECSSRLNESRTDVISRGTKLVKESLDAEKK